MTTYNASAVADAIIAHKKGITLQQGRALRDNPIAMAEGAAGAPKVAALALSSPYKPQVGSTSAAPAGWTDLDAVKELKILGNFNNNIAATRVFRLDFSNNAGGSWSGTTNMISLPGAGDAQFTIYLNLDTGAYYVFSPALSAMASGTAVLPSVCNGVRMTFSGSTCTATAFVEIVSGRSL